MPKQPNTAAQLRDIPVVRLHVAPETADLLNELLAGDELTAAAWVTRKSAYLDLYADDPSEQKVLHERMAVRLQDWAELTGPVTLESLTLPREDWTESWKKYFHPLQVSPRIAIKPTWEALPFPAPECVIEIDPGMSFGTGRHGTTLACMELLDELAADGSFLDIGCGSGILSIAAAKLGFAPVALFDYDPVAVNCAQENLLLNGILDSVPFVQDVAEYRSPERFSCVAANLETPILLPNRQQIVDAVAPGGWLILSGILITEYSQVRDVFVALGFEEEATRQRDEWQTGRFRRRV